MGHDDSEGAGRPPLPAGGPAAVAGNDPRTTADWLNWLKERLYATITMISVVIGVSAAEHPTPAGAAVSVATAAVGLWLATLVADEQAHRTVHGRVATGSELRRMLWVSSPLLLSAVGPLVLIGSAALDVMDLETALFAAAGVSVAGLFGWGCYGGIRMGNGTTVALLAGAVDAAIGVAVALVKAAAGH
ncbi:hypothetical protein [Streptomyces sp. NBC_01092]|uniref:hypothetical protein n=1 Tax=Streptomyces sp. NBC_01092 TaxID=2903748 RepID=UPI00386CCE84|nr:hypothetical protein OG254_41985 [Streptomyces sp. NBC_01092]